MNWEPELHVSTRQRSPQSAMLTLEPRAEELPDVLRMLQVQRRIDLVKNVHRSRLELQQCHDEGECDE